MLREENEVHADKSDPEMQLADKFGIGIAEHFAEPVIPARENGEHGTQRQHIMEMCHDEISVVISAVYTGICQHHARDAAKRKQENKAKRPKHWGFELDRSAPHGGDP